jgi:hypothetical protein
MNDTAPSAHQTVYLSNQFPLSGTCEGRFSLTSVKKDFLSSLLPLDLELASQCYTDNAHHPLLFIFDYTHLHFNDFLATIAKENGAALALDYHEAIVMLPFVQFKDPAISPRGPFCFLPVLYLDSELAVWGGRIFWEFNKELATFDTSGTIFNVSPVSDASSPPIDVPYFTSLFDLRQTSFPATGLPNFRAIEPILTLPVIEFGVFGYVSSIYKIMFEKAIISPCATTINNDSCKYLPPGVLNSPPLTTDVLGSFFMNYDFELSYAKHISTLSL